TRTRRPSTSCSANGARLTELVGGEELFDGSAQRNRNRQCEPDGRETPAVLDRADCLATDSELCGEFVLCESRGDARPLKSVEWTSRRRWITTTELPHVEPCLERQRWHLWYERAGCGGFGEGCELVGADH